MLSSKPLEECHASCSRNEILGCATLSSLSRVAEENGDYSVFPAKGLLAKLKFVEKEAVLENMWDPRLNGTWTAMVSNGEKLSDAKVIYIYLLRPAIEA